MNVSVVIPTYNGRHLLEKNLKNVFAALRDGDEVIIVDDCSSDDTLSWLTVQYDLRHSECTPDQGTGIAPSDILCHGGSYNNIRIHILVNQTNQRFANSCNRGVANAMHEIIVLLNNDVSPEPNFLEFLLPHFDQSKVFGVGCKELASAEANKEYGRAEGHFERGFYVHQRSEDQNGTDTAWIAGGSGAFRKSMWLELKGFDLDYRPAYWEDIDLSFRAKRKGWDVLFEPKSVVHHNHESTNTSVFGKEQIEIMGFKNQILFTWKNAPFSELLKHFLWLPYHFIFTSARSHGNFTKGFKAALHDFFT